MARPHPRNHGCRLTVCEIEGLETVVLENAALRVSVLAGKGADVFEFLYKPLDADPLWRAPNGIVNPARGTPSSALTDGAFMDVYEGGWQELFPTLGAPATVHGAPLGEHGEVALLPWDVRIDRDDPEGVAVTFSVECRRTPFRLRRTLRLEGDAAVLRIDEEAENAGAEPLDFMWGHHPVLGAPFLAPGCRLSLPGGRVQGTEVSDAGFHDAGEATDWPVYRSPAGHEEDLRRLPEPGPAHIDELYVSGLPAGWYAVTNPELGAGFGLRWDLETFPYLWLWRTLGAAPGYPWYGRTYTLGLEPFSSVPPQYPDARAAGTLHRLEPGATLATSLTAVAFAGDGDVASIEADGTVVGGGQG
jgi:hypothetical protein